MRRKISTNLVSCLLLALILLVGGSGYAQERSVSGTVIDLESGEALPGVNVLAKGTSIGTVTDVEGNYRLTINDNISTLVFSSIGYTSEEVEINGQSTIDLQLAPDIQSLSEVVVIGYGTQQKRDITGSIASVDAEALEKVAVTGLDQALQGRAPGVYVTQNSGEPGGGVSVRIRGIGSNRSNEPLYVVDGFPLSGSDIGAAGGLNPLSTLNPQDIESIEILKDASAAAIYGARGANGVVLITTKRGKSGAIDVNFDAYVGVQQAWKLPELLNAEEFATLHNETYTRSDLDTNPEWANPASLGEGTDWLDAIFRTAPIQNYSLSVNGGNEKVRTRLSANYFNQEGIVISSGFERYSLRANIDYTVNDRVTIGANFTPTYSVRDDVSDAGSQNILVFAQKMYPTLGLNDAVDGDPQFYPQTNIDNPVLYARDVDGKQEALRVLGNTFLEYELIEGLRYKLNTGIDMIWGRGTFQVPTIDRGPAVTGQFPFNVLNIDYSDERTWLIENTLNYDKSFAGGHQLGLLVGYTSQKSTDFRANASGQRFQNDAVTSINAAPNDFRNGGGRLSTGWFIESIIGRANYSFQDKYLLTASVRRDGSSRFTERNRYGVFPAASVGWRLSEEGFMSGASFIDDLKLRASWGQLGSDRITAFEFLNAYSIGDNFAYSYGDNTQQGGVLTRLGNENLKWETSEQLDFGIDLSLFGGQLGLTADYFIKETKDLLVPKPLPSTVGIGSSLVNGGAIENRGLELALNHRHSWGDFSYDISVNFTTIENEVLSLGADVEEQEAGFLRRETLAGNTTESKVGEPIGYFRGYIVDGVIQREEEIPAHLDGFEPGDFIYRDVNEDGSLNDEDVVKIGNPFPDYDFGLNVGLKYQGFDLDFFLQGVQGNEVLLVTKRATYHVRNTNGNVEALNRWHGPGTSNSFPRLDFDGARNFETPSTFFVEDGSYVRCRNLSLGYTFGEGLSEMVGLSRVRVYTSAQNLFTITNYPGFDPEIGGSNALSYGIDTGRYPSARVFRLGLSVNF